MASLSVVLATYNEEKNIASCLASVKDIADEIIIVDGESTDTTRQIAQEYTKHISVVTNKKNFHINKQIAIDKATKTWILQLDADEHVSKELAKELREIVNTNSEDFNGYWIPRKNWFLGRFLKKGGQYPDYTLRLYRKGKGQLPQQDVHEQAVVEGKVGYLHHALLHYPYDSFASYLTKWKRYVEFEGREIRKSKNIFNPLYGIKMLCISPLYWFVLSYLRHKGFVDGWPGFVFSLFSSLRFPSSYLFALFAQK